MESYVVRRPRPPVLGYKLPTLCFHWSLQSNFLSLSFFSLSLSSLSLSLEIMASSFSRSLSMCVVVLVLSVAGATAGSVRTYRFDELFQPSWALDHFTYEGELLKMKLDNYSGKSICLLRKDPLFSALNFSRIFFCEISSYFIYSCDAISLLFVEFQELGFRQRASICSGKSLLRSS